MSFSINRAHLTYGLDLAKLTGIEIGPLVNPIVTRDQSNVKYVDRASTEELREWYSKAPQINVDEIMDIDYIWGEQSLAEATGSAEQFDYCIASHVIEHIPDLITWLQEISSILKVGGVACFAVPDKRYTFDYLRPITEAADLVDNYLNKIRKPSFRHIYDHFSNFADLDITAAWTPGFDGSDLVPQKTAAQTYAVCLDALKGDKYIDSHCSVFTEDSFFDLLATISELGLLDFKIRRNFSINRGAFEFFVQLEKIDSSLSAKEKLAQFSQSHQTMKSTGLELTFTSNIACEPKVYYHVGGGFNELEIMQIEYSTPNQASKLYFNLPQTDDIKLRFDPADSQSEFQISEVRYHRANQVRDVPLEAFKPLNDIAKSTIERESLHIQTTPNANDPSFLIELN